MQDKPQYDDVVGEIATYLKGRVEACLDKGFEKKQLIIDPGFGFGKTTTHNLILLKRLADLVDMGFPVMVGLSRKRSIGEILNRSTGDRLFGSLAAAVIAVLNGASIVRVHDVEATVDAIKVVTATQRMEMAIQQ